MGNYIRPLSDAVFTIASDDLWIESLAIQQLHTTANLPNMQRLKPLIKSESELTVDASITAKPFFERYGFQPVKQQRVECRGEWFINFYMRYKQQH